ncbi:hypothetical protein AFE_1581 [Acidithiobacillus ferrooxidans ATCC 23270]|uniref:Uncharacterized protein n=1 Tax=Acidithiobacillus ferrooxidans (strain ATCC 23270 / DSM 14882 / CIP 104768 / NCIMB 8455) TaxID=243159 RepID=B7JAF6_ACIF2|nr:hypothetical protein AFE_1581 [Acidithiobacillus ferrooxidans ATCC 23270]
MEYSLERGGEGSGTERKIKKGVTCRHPAQYQRVGNAPRWIKALTKFGFITSATTGSVLYSSKSTATAGCTATSATTRRAS